MFYFLQEHYELSENTFDVSDILSASEPMDWHGTGTKRPADSGMIDFWNDAIDKYRKQGKPDWKKLKKIKTNAMYKIKYGAVQTIGNRMYIDPD